MAGPVAIEVNVEQEITPVSREVMVGNERGEVEKRIVVARIFPVEKTHVRRCDDVFGDEIVVTANQLLRMRHCLDGPEMPAHQPGIGTRSLAGILPGRVSGIERPPGQRQAMQPAQRPGETCKFRVVVKIPAGPDSSLEVFGHVDGLGRVQHTTCEPLLRRP